MANFQVGDKVKIIGLTRTGETGKITSKSVRPTQTTNTVALGRAYDTEAEWHLWQVKLDKSGSLKTFPDDELEKL